MTNSGITINASNAALPTLLGNKGAATTRIATGGKIRAGIKVLTKKAAENPQAKQIYEQGVSDGQSFEQIEKNLFEALPNLKTPLVPKNVPWFTVRSQDFPNPAIAGQILDAYGEDRGDGVKRLYRFPVVFPSEIWQTVMPHELVAWGANERRYWSEYSPDGRARLCKCHAPVLKIDSGKRAIRIFGGRKSMLRPENGGLCEPESCEQYQQRQCNLSGRFIFFIPGIKSISAFELHTNSFYAMNSAIQKFETIAFMRGGRISGFLDSDRTPFYLSKMLMEVPHIDEEGRAVRVKQWIIELEAPVDVTALLRTNDDAETAIVNAQVASRILEAPHDESHEGLPSYAESVPQTMEKQRQAAAASKTNSRKQVTATDAVPELEAILEIACHYGLEPAQYEAYANRRWGSGWKLNANGRLRARDELDRYQNDPLGFKDKVLAQLKPVTVEDES
jgi:hypothetical protein